MKHRVNWNLNMGTQQFHEGDEIDLDAQKSQELRALGVVTPLEVVSVAGAGDEVATVSEKELAKMSKDQLAAYSWAKYGKELDVTTMSKDQMLAEIAALATEK